MKSTTIFCLCLLNWATLRTQTTITFTPSKDNTLFEISATSSNGAGSSIFAGNDNNGKKHRALMRFNLSSIPATATINNVTLQIRVNKTVDGTSRSHKLHKLSADWGEGTSSGIGAGAPATTNDATWTDRFFGVSTWLSLGGDFDATASGTTSIGGVGSYTFPSTTQLVADVQAWVASSATNFGWALLGDEGNSRTARGFDSREGSNRPTLTVTYTTVVPVELIDFDANVEKSAVHLGWTTASELNSSHFDIEVWMPKKGGYTDGTSRDSREVGRFEKISAIKAIGNSQMQHHYAFTHDVPNEGIYFYRLKQVDITGTFQYSPIISAVVGKKKDGLMIYPNPVKDKLTLSHHTLQVGLDIVDITGRLVRQLPPETTDINVSDLPKGLYYARQVVNGEVLVQKFVKD